MVEKHRHFHIPQQLAKQLERLWVSYPCYHHNNQWLWEHEYNKHGFMFKTPEKLFQSSIKSLSVCKSVHAPTLFTTTSHTTTQKQSNQNQTHL